jgi:hypothetical protein
LPYDTADVSFADGIGKGYTGCPTHRRLIWSLVSIQPASEICAKKTLKNQRTVVSAKILRFALHAKTAYCLT